MILPWIDIETTGLNYKKDLIIEIGIILTDENLQILDETAVVIGHSYKRMCQIMESVVKDMHEKSGLLERSANSKISYRDAELYLNYWLKKNDINNAPMCGSSVSFDRLFLQENMPSLDKFFHYRNLDVSTIKVLTQAWYPQVYNKRPRGEKDHTTLSDLRDSIEELSFYRNKIFT